LAVFRFFYRTRYYNSFENLFQALAIQEGHPYAQAKVTIIVNDKNDHRPIFKEINYSARVKENAPLNHTVVQVNVLF